MEKMGGDGTMEGDETEWTTVGWERKMWRQREREREMANGKEEESGFETKGRQFKLAEC